jgi:transglutaminase-like putative cysteine protease
MDWLSIFGERFNRAFTSTGRRRLISTPLAEVIAERRGVCQDFAHLLISCLRQNAAARRIRERLPPHKAALGPAQAVGADASHAWVSALSPAPAGSITIRPTPASSGAGHIVVARGRDFFDVSPVKGLFSGGGEHLLETGVTVEEAEWAGRTE